MQQQFKDPRDMQYEDTDKVPVIQQHGYVGMNPCPGWHPQVSRHENIEQVLNTWFVKGLKVLGIFYVLAITSIFLWKLLVMVVAMK